MIDVPSQQQFGERLPIVRRVRLNGVHILVTYDPNIIYGSQPVGETSPPLAGETRDITIDDFDGVVGRTLTLPADEQVRIFILRE